MPSIQSGQIPQVEPSLNTWKISVQVGKFKAFEGATVRLPQILFQFTQGGGEGGI